MGCAVCLWLLQRNAHLYAAWLGSNGAVQAENLVYLLPDGYYDADDLQNEAVEDINGLYGDVYYSTKNKLIKTKTNILISMKNEYQSELLFPDTDLQFYMGVLKAQLEEHCVDNEVVRSYQQLVNQEKDYLNKEEWLSEQVQKLNNELKKIK